jgi:acyl-homoserine lactone acylase PvdQ
MHETKMIGRKARLGLFTAPHNEYFVYNSIKEWAKSSDPVYEEYCYVTELKGKNSCQEFMAYTLSRAFDDMVAHMGSPVGTNAANWTLTNLTRVRFTHAPFSNSPLFVFYEHRTKGYGHRRTVNLSMLLPYKEATGEEYDLAGGSTVRMIVDFSEEDHVLIMHDLGMEPAITSPYRADQMKLFDRGQYFVLPTKEIPGE